MFVNNLSRKSKFTTALGVVFFTLGLLGCTQSEKELQLKQDTNAETEPFTRLDVDALNTYRGERLASVEKSLVVSELSEAHRELLANAMAKIYLGVPVSSFTESTSHSFLNEEAKTVSRDWEVIEAGHIEGKTDSSVNGLFLLSPFLALPPDPFVPETAKLLEESDTSATFVFEIKKPKHIGSRDSVFTSVSGNLNWIMEITASKTHQSPEHIVIKIDAPAQENSESTLETFSLEFSYTYVKSCDCFAANKSKIDFAGSDEQTDRMSMSMQTTFSNIVCVQPLQFLLPELEESVFLPL